MCNIPHFTCTHKNFLEHTPPFTHMELVKRERVELSRTKIENFIYGEMVATHEREVYFLFYLGLFLCQHIDLQSSMWVKGGVGHVRMSTTEGGYYLKFIWHVHGRSPPSNWCARCHHCVSVQLVSCPFLEFLFLGAVPAGYDLYVACDA